MPEAEKPRYEIPEGGRHFFVHDARHFPVACIATKKFDNMLFYGLSVCNPLDYENYNRDRARQIAYVRLKHYIDGKVIDLSVKAGTPKFKEAKTGEVSFNVGESPKQILLEHLVRDKELPKRFRENLAGELYDLIERIEARRKQTEADAKADVAAADSRQDAS